MLRSLLRRYGVLRLTVAVTLLAVLSSVVLSALMSWLLGGSPLGPIGLAISIAVPAIIAPLFGAAQLALLDQLIRAEERLHTLAITDELTGAYNRRHFMDLAERELARARRYGEDFAVAILDIDDFKVLNDTFGHLAGDEVLRAVSGVCRRTIRASDTFARYGGDEFVVLFPRASRAQAREVVQRIHQALSALELPGLPPALRLHVSAGVAAYEASTRPAIKHLDDLLRLADEALYAEKRRPRDAQSRLPAE